MSHKTPTPPSTSFVLNQKKVESFYRIPLFLEFQESSRFVLLTIWKTPEKILSLIHISKPIPMRKPTFSLSMRLLSKNFSCHLHSPCEGIQIKRCVSVFRNTALSKSPILRKTLTVQLPSLYLQFWHAPTIKLSVFQNFHQ